MASGVPVDGGPSGLVIAASEKGEVVTPLLDEDEDTTEERPSSGPFAAPRAAKRDGRVAE
jgi:hypothetical protein